MSGPKADKAVIRAHAEMLHARAALCCERGKLVVTGFGENPDRRRPTTGKPGLSLPSKIHHIDLGDIEGMVDCVSQLATKPHYNVYTALAVYRPDLRTRDRGRLEDIIAIVGLVVDFDDAQAGQWQQRLPITPQLVLETSCGRYQAFYLFDQPQTPETVKHLAERLRTITGCDYGTADLDHVWRIAGTLNWPNAKKIGEGRCRHPQLVSIAKSWDGQTISVVDLDVAVAMLERRGRSNGAKSFDKNRDPERPCTPSGAGARHKPVNNTQADGAAVPAGLQHGLDEIRPLTPEAIEAIVRMLPQNLRNRFEAPSTGDRSKTLYCVISALIARGFDDPTIEAIIRHHPSGIGAKYVGRTDLDHEINRIRSKTSKRQAAKAQVATMLPQGRPVIKVVGGALPKVIDEAERHLIAVDKTIYQFGGLMVRLAIPGEQLENGKVISGLRLISMSLYHLIERLTRVADFQRWDGRSAAWTSIDCPATVAKAYLERVGNWKLPITMGIVDCPTLRPDGSILDTPGYDPQTGIVYNALGTTFPPIPSAPTKADAAAALNMLLGLIAEFPFVDLPSRSVALSAFMTAVARPGLPTAPLHAFTAPAPGTGKSLLVDLVSIVKTGHPAPVIAQGRTEDETEKRLGATLIAGDPIVAIDNCKEPLGGAFICQMLTQPHVAVRLLGKSERVIVPCTATLFATGNNLIVTGDMTRRVLMSSLDAKCEQPELRTFQANAIEVVKRNRGRFVAAVLTILRAFVEAGRPRQAPPVGSFEEWSCIRDALLWLGEADPLSTVAGARAQDPQFQALHSIICQWEALIGIERVTVAKLINIGTMRDDNPTPANDPDNVIDAWIDGPPRPFRNEAFREALLIVAGEGGVINSRSLGKWLAANKGRIVGGLRIVQDGESSGVAQWRLERVDATI